MKTIIDHQDLTNSKAFETSTESLWGEEMTAEVVTFIMTGLDMILE